MMVFIRLYDERTVRLRTSIPDRIVGSILCRASVQKQPSDGSDRSNHMTLRSRCSLQPGLWHRGLSARLGVWTFCGTLWPSFVGNFVGNFFE